MAGKGGVGRSTVAASIAAATAQQGRRTLLFEANAKDRYGDFFGHDPIGTEITQLRENLFAVNTNPAAALEEYGLMVLRFKRVYRLVFENRVTKAFIKAIPGVEDYALLGKAWFHTEETKRGAPVWDTVVFDMAASGHSLSMLRIPWAITSTVPDGPLTRDAHKVQQLLLDKDRTAVVMVTMAEDMPTNEAIELSGALRRHIGMEVDHVVVNQLYQDRFSAGSPQRMVLDALQDTEDPKLEPIARHGQQSKSRRLLNEEHLKHLSKDLSVPQVHLPRLFVPAIGEPEIETLSALLNAGFSS